MCFLTFEFSVSISVVGVILIDREASVIRAFLATGVILVVDTVSFKVQPLAIVEAIFAIMLILIAGMTLVYEVLSIT